MALSPNDRYYRAETTPASITALGHGLCSAFGQPADAFGSKGNEVHESGYHRSRAWILHSPDSRYGSNDYSVRQQLDLGGSDDDVCAADFNPAEWGSAKNRRLMSEITARVHAAAVARDPRLADWREFAGTLDGRTVVTFNCADGSLKAPFDSSHLDHFHASGWRSRIRNDHSGLLQILTATPSQGDDMTDEQWKTLQRVALTLGWLVQGQEKTGPQPGLPEGMLFDIKPNQQLKQLVAALGQPAPVSLTDAQLDVLAGKVAGQLAPLLPSLADIKALVRAQLDGTHLTGS